MVSLILIWTYMLVISYIIGSGFCFFIKKRTGSDYTCRNQIAFILAGVGVLIFYAQLFSLFYKVGLVANIVLVLITILTAWIYKEEIIDNIKILRNTSSVRRLIVYVVLFLIMVYGSSHGFMHYDSDLYHAQSIRWIEEFGVIKGLGNLHTRLAYNSSAFCLSALFSFSFLGIQSFHGCAGFLAFVTSLMTVDLFKDGLKIKACLSNMVRLIAIYYLLTIYDEMVSPASDYFMVLFTLCTVILYLECIEGEERNSFPYAMLSLLTLTILSIKISGSIIILLAVYPAYILIKESKFKEILIFLLTGIISVIPFFVRNIILSGYLVYPVPSVDLFKFNYKIPRGLAEYDSREIQVYGRGYSDVTRFNEPITKWIGNWIASLDFVNKLSFLLGVMGLAALVIMLAALLVKKDYLKLPRYLVMVTLNLSFVFWMLTSPNIRYGCIFLWLAPMMVWGEIYINLISKLDKNILFRAFVFVFFLYKAYAFITEVAGNNPSDYLLLQQDYGSYPVEEVKVDDLLIYIPTEGDQTGYTKFPSTPQDITRLRLLGKDIRSGFRLDN